MGHELFQTLASVLPFLGFWFFRSHNMPVVCLLLLNNLIVVVLHILSLLLLLADQIGESRLPHKIDVNPR